MIELDLKELSVVVVGGALLWVFLLSWMASLRERRESRRADKGKRVCRLCLAVFESRTREEVQHCPECGAPTESKGPRPLA